MATPRDPIGVVLYLVIAFLVQTLGLQIRKDEPVSVEYEPDPEPRWLYCLNCESRTVHEPHFWVEDGESDYECTACGAVTYG